MRPTGLERMRFNQLDKITELKPGEKIVAVRQVHDGEDYLRDHFPLFKVMPGVLMLEALFQASCCLIQATDDFKYSLLVLKEARNVKFGDFMRPGQCLTIMAEFQKTDGNCVTMKATGMKDGNVAVSAKLIISKEDLSSKDPGLADLDEFMRESKRQILEKLTLGMGTD